MKKFLFSVIAVVAFGMTMASCSYNAPKAKFNNDLDSLGYAYGVMFGNQYSNFTDSGVVVPEVTMELDNFLAGFITAIKRDSANLKMTIEEAQQFLQEFNQKLQVKMNEKREAELKANKDAGAEFMAKNANLEGVVTLESGLQIKTLTEGTGAKPSTEDKVLVNYVGTLIDGTQFDANDSIEFSLSGVVKGFSEGISNMKEGGSAIITMPSDMAYGDRSTGNIPAGSTLQFKVDLLKIVK
ncbi:MAG: FKBP-type peptidyl-prolyl cis-trans isomerase [Bacteroidales bacterium]|nr:FKBP-type peptidyl-prolyl cis-trans isomerase [Bacteroidales bacterium]